MKKGLCRTLLGEVYWYANISGRNTYLGKVSRRTRVIRDRLAYRKRKGKAAFWRACLPTQVLTQWLTGSHVYWRSGVATDYAPNSFFIRFLAMTLRFMYVPTTP